MAKSGSASEAITSTREAGSLQGWILVSTAWLAVIATSLIAPVLPRMAQHFEAVANATSLIQLSIALPALFVALFAAPLGVFADRIGRRTVLWMGLIAYALVGIAPLWLDSLPMILVTRCGVGIAEAAVMTAGTAMLGDYFKGASRERWFAVQTGSATIVAVGILTLGGFLGEISWRAPFAVYGLPLIMAAFVLLFTWEPRQGPSAVDAPEEPQGALRWKALLSACVVTLFGSMAFYVVIIQLGFILTSRGFSSPSLIGLGSAVAAAAVPIGAVLFRILGRASVSRKLMISFTISAAGFALIAFTRDYPLTILGAAINGVGSGIALPTLLTWAVGGLDQSQRGRASGAWNSAFFLGQFLSPISVLALAAALGGPQNAVLAYGAACGVAALIAMTISLRTPAR